jgi:hypothetical protein
MSDEKKNDGGPAFPSTEYNINGGNYGGGYSIYDQHKGMSLRNYFATRAMQGIRSNEESMKNMVKMCNDHKIDLHTMIAEVAFAQADAMIKSSEQ